MSKRIDRLGCRYLVSSDTHSVQEWSALLNYQLSKCGSESGSTASEAISLCRTASADILSSPDGRRTRTTTENSTSGGGNGGGGEIGVPVPTRGWSSADLSEMSPTPASMASAASAAAAGAPPLIPPPVSPTTSVNTGAMAGRRASISDLVPPPAATTARAMVCQVMAPEDREVPTTNRLRRLGASAFPLSFWILHAWSTFASTMGF